MDGRRESLGWPLLFIGVSVGLWSILLSFVEGPIPLVWGLGAFGGVLIGAGARSLWRERREVATGPGIAYPPESLAVRLDPRRATYRFRSAMIMVALFLTFLPLAIGVSQGPHLVLDDFYELSALLIGSGIVVATVGLISRPRSSGSSTG